MHAIRINQVILDQEFPICYEFYEPSQAHCYLETEE